MTLQPATSTVTSDVGGEPRLIAVCHQRMIPKSGYRFSEKIMRQQKVKARWRFEEKSSRFSVDGACFASVGTWNILRGEFVHLDPTMGFKEILLKAGAPARR